MTFVQFCGGSRGKNAEIAAARKLIGTPIIFDIMKRFFVVGEAECAAVLADNGFAALLKGRQGELASAIGENKAHNGGKRAILKRHCLSVHTYR